jgi:hypothetical protein
MPAKRATPEKEYARNAKTWKQVTTTVPPQMLEVLKSRVTEDFTMSHVLRELIAESSLMRYGQLPRPRWCADLIDQVAALKEEVSQLRKDMQATPPAAEPAPAQLIRTYAIDAVLQSPIRSIAPSPDFDDFDYLDQYDDVLDDPWCQKIIQEVLEEDLPLEASDEKAQEKLEYESVEAEDEPLEERTKEPAQEKARDGKTLFGRLTAMLGGARKTA